MANVYLAEDGELDRRVAIKILNDRYATDELFVERFRREAKSAAALSHPNIVSIYDRGRGRGHLLHRDGGDRGPEPQGADPCERASPSRPGRLLHAPDPLGAAIRAPERDHPPGHQAAQHPRRPRGAPQGHGFRHRARRGLADDRGRLDHGHGAVPVARAGPGRQVSGASDLYSVGVVLYEMLTGEVPFTGDTAVEIAMKHVNDAPRPPSATAPGIPADLDRVVLRCLAKNPADRYQTAEELDSDLARVRGRSAGRRERRRRRRPSCSPARPRPRPRCSGRLPRLRRPAGRRRRERPAASALRPLRPSRASAGRSCPGSSSPSCSPRSASPAGTSTSRSTSDCRRRSRSRSRTSRGWSRSEPSSDSRPTGSASRPRDRRASRSTGGR